MSGQQIGSTIGLVVGSYFGGPVGGAIGSAIGGYIGGAIDPTIIKGPKIGDGQTQTSTDGQPIAWIQGTATVAGTIVQVSPRRQIRHKDGGKGSGTVNETFTAQQDFAILVCESCELRDSTMTQIIMVYQDGKLVYDVRAGSTMLDDSAKWKANVDFLYGAEDQMPHPTLEAITGVGNTPAYRGSCLAVFKNFDVTSSGDRIPQFNFVVTSKGVDPIKVEYTDDFKWKMEIAGSTADYSSPTYDDSLWEVGPGGFGNVSESGIPLGTFVPSGMVGRAIWLRKALTLPASSGTLKITVAADDGAWLWVNGVEYQNGVVGGEETAIDIPSLGTTDVVVSLKVMDGVPSGISTNIFAAMQIETEDPVGSVPLDVISRRICKRGGLADTDIDTTGLPIVSIFGYMVATPSNASDCLSPLLGAFFAFASDYDAKLYFHSYGADAPFTLTSDNLIETDQSNGASITRTLRNQETEFPLRVVASYYDPIQNYKVVQVAARRRATTVKAIGDQQFQIPAAISAADAAQLVDKALKVAYATLQGTLEMTVPFADTDCYLSLPAGFPLIFEGKRYVIDGLSISQGTLDFKLRYDRQSAYTSDVQPILGNAPTPPTSRFSGPTTLIAMDLPAQRPQDSVGVYLAAASTDGRQSWLGCNVQVSYDAQQTWNPALTITTESTLGSFVHNEPVGGEPLTVRTVKFPLESATPEQLAAAANAFATVLTDGTTQIGQFATATELTDGDFELTNVTRGLGGVPAFTITTAQPFVLMGAAYFFPIAPEWVGRTIYFRAAGFGESMDDALIISVVYNALVTKPGKQMTTEAADPMTAEDGLTNIFTES